MQPNIDWSQPQRQPFTGLVITLLQSFGSVLKRLWPFLLLALFQGKQKEFDFYDGVLLSAALLTIIGSISAFLFFRFYIDGEELIIKKGWLKKQVLTVPLHKIHAVHIEQGLLHQLLNIVKLSADTAGSNKTEVTIHALRQPMAEALRHRLSQQRSMADEEQTESTPTPLLTLSEKDLLKLSISANHVEAFFILLSAVYGIFENIKTVNEDWVEGAEGWLPAGSVPLLLLLATTVLLITILISTTRIFFRFYGFSAFATPLGLQLRSGLANTRERLVALKKVQFVSWRANWVRRRLGLWLLQYHTAGADEVKSNMKAQVPITQKHFISLLVQPYHPLPDLAGTMPVRVHPIYPWRQLLLAGLVPALVLIAATVYWWGAKSFIFLLWPPLAGWRAWLYQQKFRLYLYEEVLYLRRGVWGLEKLILKWNAAQSIAISQSLYQRRKGLANITIHTAAGDISLPYLDITEARQIVNYGLYKVEKESETFI